MKQPGEEIANIFLANAEESLAGAESVYANRRYNNCANRCYYACFQAAIMGCHTEFCITVDCEKVLKPVQA